MGDNGGNGGGGGGRNGSWGDFQGSGINNFMERMIIQFTMLSVETFVVLLVGKRLWS